MSYSEILESEFRKLDLDLPANQRDKLAVYCSELDHWNKKINLTKLAGVGLVRRLVAEPSWIGDRLGISGTLADIGSGNGAPALPLRLTRPVEKLHLVESRQKRVAFLRHLTATLVLSGIYIHNERFETLDPSVEATDWITLQAVALNASLLQALRRWSSPTTKVVWITAGREAPTPAANRILVPGSSTEVWVFKLDGTSGPLT